jgi:DNA polymerase
MFIGPSGPIFDRLIRHAGLNREDFYMSNLIKCMLPKSRRPAREEIGQCSQYLLQEFRLVHPSVLVPLGFHSTRFIFKEFNIAFPPKNEVHALFGQLLETPLYWIYPLRHPTALLFNPEKLDVMQKNYAMLFMLLKDDRYA